MGPLFSGGGQAGPIWGCGTIWHMLTEADLEALLVLSQEDPGKALGILREIRREMMHGSHARIEEVMPSVGADDCGAAGGNEIAGGAHPKNA